MSIIYRINLSFLLIIFTLNVSAQDYFNYRFEYDLHGSIDSGKSLLEVDDGFIIGGMTLGNNGTGFRIALRKIDFGGREVWTKIWGEDFTHYWLGYPGSLIKSSGHGYLLCGTFKEMSVGNAALLMKLDAKFDTIWTKHYHDTITPYNIYYYGYQLIENTDGSIVIVGDRKPNGMASKIWLMKADAAGNQIWSKFYGPGGAYFEGFCVASTTDDGYVIGGYIFVLNNMERNSPILVKVDSLGNQEWIIDIGGPYLDTPASVDTHPDGGIIVGTCIGDTMISPYAANSRITLMKLNNEGDILWEREYGQINIDRYLFNVRCLDDGSIISTGLTTPYYPHAVGWILKVDSEGNQLWYREYENLSGSNSKNWLLDVIQTRDNSFLACGELFPAYPDTGTQDAWVIKLDSLGCEFPLCDTTVGLNELELFEDCVMSIYPNPSSSYITIQLNVPQNAGENPKYKQLKIYDHLGRKIDEVSISQFNKTINIDITSWKSGMYYAIVRGKNKILAKGKFIVH